MVSMRFSGVSCLIGMLARSVNTRPILEYTEQHLYNHGSAKPKKYIIFYANNRTAGLGYLRYMPAGLEPPAGVRHEETVVKGG